MSDPDQLTHVKADDESYDVVDRDQNEFDDDALENSVNEEAAQQEEDKQNLKRLRDTEEQGEGGDEDDDEEEEEEDEDDDITNKKRKRRRAANQFVDIEAEVDDEEEDELDEDDEEAELLREQFISDDRDNAEGNDGDNQDDRLHRQYDRRRQEAEDQNAEKLAETLKQRYRKTHTVYRGDSATSGTVSQKLLMPSINDPSIYAIRCTPGREKELVRKLYEKKRTLDRLNRPLDILTVFQRDAFKGYIYIEAKRPDAIDSALVGMVNIFARNKLLVPVKEYPDLLKQVKSSDVEIVPGIYIRITRGKYKNDLAIVDNLSENGLDVRCKLVPRLDYGRNDEIDKDGKKIKLKVRPLPRLFNEQEARMYDGEFLQPGRGPRSFVYRGEEYNDGFLFKDFKLQFIQTKDVHPSLEELDKFQAGNSEEDGLDLAAIAASLKSKNKSDGKQSTAFQPGDKVEIRRGEQAKTVGLVVEASLNEITISVTWSGDPKFVNQKLTVPANDLRKIFNEGDHVRIVEGKHFDETGLVIKIDGDSVVLVSDQTREDVRVFANYLVKATDSSLNIDTMNSKYDIKDLVELNASSVGVIVKAEKGIFEVLTSDGRILPMKPSGIASKLQLSRREQVATDRNGFTVKVGDTVREALGDKKKEGVILHIYKNSLFIKSNEVVENLGIFVTNRMDVSTITTKDSMVSKSLGPDLSRMNPNLKLPNPGAATAGLKTRVGGRDKLLNKDVAVTSGSYKGLKGKVVETDDINARIELHTKSKKIKVNKNSLNVLIRGEAIPYLRFIGAASNDAPQFNKPSAPAFSSGGRSSWNGGATPSVGGGGSSSWGNAGGASSWGGATAWGGGKTPAYNGGKTPGAGGASTWGGSGGSSSWNQNGGNSTWGGSGGNGGNSTWGSKGGAGGNSTWGNNNGGNSSWGNNNGGNSSWGNNNGGNSTWGSSGGNSSWGNKGGRSSWGQQ
ncbi:transcription elongation factor Spt5 [Suhomyces tanzawaensis NRRL Y-17324]|uniref:Transcription elongation factor SPT5 n=1 Tax=Suhomyces tanzawaensis NRRL Y-17324 TaxID=984487 RepID=A0A1E4SCB2_9ASCO|nr:transcription elongation factor Spt5 [Suhomyces tanzawaensis NRRL Y-17324]ODV77116.1 transcription elongation factor Spt5 [Suhomyces tanzawaensis NRRL Y-17324]